MRIWIERILTLVILGTALAFGGVVPPAYSSMEIAVFVMVCVVIGGAWFRRETPLRLPWPVWALLGWVALEVVPLPSPLIRAVSPTRLSWMTLPEPRWLSSFWLTLSIDPHATQLHLMRLLAYVCAFTLAAWAFEPRKGKSPLITGLIGLGTFEAMYGLYEYLTGHQKIFGYTKTAYISDATGTYINRNHFAGLLELTIPLVIAAAYYQFQLWQRGRWKSRQNEGAASGSAFHGFFYVIFAVLMGVAAICSHSRTGIFGMLLSLTLIFLLGQARSNLKMWKVASLFVIFGILAYGFWVGLGPALQRFEHLEKAGYLQQEGRIHIWEDAEPLIRDYPVTGTGLGTFGEAYRRYQRHFTYAFVSHAHSDYVEFTCEIGLLGTILLFGSIVWLWLKSLRALPGEMGPYRSAITLGCIGSTLAILIHSATDFNLQVPANALIFATILGINYKAVLLRQQEKPIPARSAAPATIGDTFSHGAIRLN